MQLRLLLLMALILLLTNCQQDANTAILSEEEMAEVLYDYQLATALAAQVKAGDSETLLRYRQSVYYKHHISEADFERSMQYYSRQTKKMERVYQLVQRINPVGSDRVMTENAVPTQAGGDTLVLWSKKDVTLIANRQNRYVAHLPMSDSLRSGEQLFLRIKPQWHYRQGSKQGVGILMVRFADGEVLSKTQNIYEYEEWLRLQLDIDRDRPVKEIIVQVYQRTKWEPNPQIMNLHDINLLKVSKKLSTKKDESRVEEKTDSTDIILHSESDTLPDAPVPIR